MVANQKTPVSQESKFYFAFRFKFNIVLKKDIRSSMLKIWVSFLNILIFTTVDPCQMWTDLVRFLFQGLCSGEACGATGPCLVDLNSVCWTCCVREEPWETLTDGARWSCSVLLGWRTENRTSFTRRLAVLWEGEQGLRVFTAYTPFVGSVYSIHQAGITV